MKKRHPFRDIPALTWLEGASGAPRATLEGCGRALIENHTGILEYTAQSVRLQTRLGPMSLEGEALSVAQARAGVLLVEGRISRLILPGGAHA